jgi:hypothetical protein
VRCTAPDRRIHYEARHGTIRASEASRASPSSHLCSSLAKTERRSLPWTDLTRRPRRRAGAALGPVDQLLRSHPEFIEVVIERAHPERQIRFDDLRGEPRNTDLAIEVRDRNGVVAVTIEGKADESFDRTVNAVQSAVERIARDERTGAILRVESLSATLLPRWRAAPAHLGDLRYQLLTGIAGTLAWAREIGAGRAVFVVHEFVTDHTPDDKHAQNASDLNVFLQRLSDGAIHSASPGLLVGPVLVPGNRQIQPVPLYIGRAVRRTRSIAPS